MPGRFNPDEYEPVEDRLRRFWADHPNGRILTELVHHSDTQYIVKACVWHDDICGEMASGYAEETIGSGPVNRTHALENCETSAIGRALANANYAPKGARPSREEMEKANRQRVTPAAEARDKLRVMCTEEKLSLAEVADAYMRVHRTALSNEDNATRIDSFTELLRMDPKAVLTAETTTDG